MYTFIEKGFLAQCSSLMFFHRIIFPNIHKDFQPGGEARVQGDDGDPKAGYSSHHEGQGLTHQITDWLR